MNKTNDDFPSKVGALFSGGVQNKFGFFSSIVLLISLFLPAANISFGTMSSSGAIIAGFSGKVLFLLVLMTALLFFGGASRFLVKLLVAITLVMALFLYYDLFSGLNQANRFAGGGFARAGVGWGAFVNIASILAVSIAAYGASYAENDKTI